MTCETCLHLIRPVQVCDLWQSVVIPDHVFPVGCPSYYNTTEAVLEHHVRTGNLQFTPKPKPAQAAPGGTYSITRSKKAMDLDNWNDDIPF